MGLLGGWTFVTSYVMGVQRNETKYDKGGTGGLIVSYNHVMPFMDDPVGENACIKMIPFKIHSIGPNKQRLFFSKT